MLDKPCHGCPFTESSLVSPRRVKDIVSELTRRDCHFVCHKAETLERFKGELLICRGYYDKVYLKSGVGNLIRIADRLGGVPIESLTPEEEAEAKKTMLPHKQQERRSRR